MNTSLKQAMIAAALATAMTAGAQTPNSQTGSSDKAAYPPPPISGTTAGETRVPANRDSDAVKTCANVAASEKEACIARENARQGTGKNMGGTKGGGSDSGPAQGSSDAGATGAGATGGTSANSSDAGATQRK